MLTLLLVNVGSEAREETKGKSLQVFIETIFNDNSKKNPVNNPY